MATANTIITQKGKYEHITHDDLVHIYDAVRRYKKEGVGISKKIKELATILHCSRSTIYRIYKQIVEEIKKCKKDNFKIKNDTYLESALYRIESKRKNSSINACKIDKASLFISNCIEYLLDENVHSVDEAIAYVKKSNNYDEYVCTKTLYSYIINGDIDNYKSTMLPRFCGWKRKAKNNKKYIEKESRGTCIIDRPEEINNRSTFGHWEGDLVTGPRDGENSAYLTLCERKTRFYIMLPVKNKKAITILEALQKLKDKNQDTFSSIFKSITFDNGFEFSYWRQMEETLAIKTYFGRPYHSGDRGSNENCNGLVRRYVKKGEHIEKISKEETHKINRAINSKLRKKFGYRSAIELFMEELKSQQIGDFYPYL